MSNSRLKEMHIFEIVLLCGCILALACVPVMAASSIRFGGGEISPGEVAIFTVDANGLEGMQSIIFDLELNNTLVEIQSIHLNEDFPQASLLSNRKNETIQVILILQDPAGVTITEWTPIVDVKIASSGSKGASQMALLNAQWMREFQTHPFEQVLNGSITVSGESGANISPGTTTGSTDGTPTVTEGTLPSTPHESLINGDAVTNPPPASGSLPAGGVLCLLGLLLAFLIVLMRQDKGN
jgi:hypothetical protein